MSQRQLARDMQTEFQARFSAKQARREAAKAQKADGEMRKQITNLIKKGDKASMAQAEQKAKVLLAKEAVAKQMDQAADMAELSVAQIQANNAMNRMTAMMMQSSKTMSKAQRQMNPERVGCCLLSSLLFVFFFLFFLVVGPGYTFLTPLLVSDPHNARAIPQPKRRIRHEQQHLPRRHDPVDLGPGLGRRRPRAPGEVSRRCRRGIEPGVGNREHVQGGAGQGGCGERAHAGAGGCAAATTAGVAGLGGCRRGVRIDADTRSIPGSSGQKSVHYKTLGRSCWMLCAE